MFTRPALRYLLEGHVTRSVLGDLKDRSVIEKLVKLEDTMKPLPPIVRKDGRVLNFFGQAIITGLGMVATLMVGVSAASWWILGGRKDDLGNCVTVLSLS